VSLSRESKKCSFCDKQAVIFQKAPGTYLCKSCFIDYVERTIHKTITKYKLVKKDNKIAIGVSGGKDSLSMLYNLYNHIINILNHPRITVITINEGIKDYRDESLGILHEFVKKFNLDVDIIELGFKDEFGLSLDEIVELIIKNNVKMNACTICGTIRRRLLNDGAKRVNATKLAIGHNLDDITQTLLLNILRKDLTKIAINPPHTSIDDEEDNNDNPFITRIKPLIHLTNKEISAYCYYKGFNLQSRPCPYSQSFPIFRKTVQNFLNSFDERNFEVKYNLLDLNYQLFDILHTTSCNNPTSFQTCKTCGNPAGQTRSECLYCELKRQFHEMSKTSE
jgi:uncharacterized protein (TIGR00269 family)